MTAVICLVAAGCLLADNDNNVEWDGVSHVAWQDRRPLCPIDGEAFSILFQTFQFDITSARVRFDDGTPVWVDAVFDHDRGPYAIWRAELPAATAARLNYYVALTDGTDTDYFSVNGMSDGPPTDGGFVLEGTLDLELTVSDPVNIMNDPEGIAFDPITGHLFVVSDPDQGVWEYDLAGEFVKFYPLDQFAPTPISPQGITVDPLNSSGVGEPIIGLFIADAGIDNNEDPLGRNRSGSAFIAIFSYDGGFVLNLRL